jgi:hypothetical protein
MCKKLSGKYLRMNERSSTGISTPIQNQATEYRVRCWRDNQMMGLTSTKPDVVVLQPACLSTS